MDGFLRFLPDVFSIVSAISGLPLAFRHQSMSPGAAEGKAQRSEGRQGAL